MFLVFVRGRVSVALDDVAEGFEFFIVRGTVLCFFQLAAQVIGLALRGLQLDTHFGKRLACRLTGAGSLRLIIFRLLFFVVTFLLFFLFGFFRLRFLFGFFRLRFLGNHGSRAVGVDGCRGVRGNDGPRGYRGLRGFGGKRFIAKHLVKNIMDSSSDGARNGSLHLRRGNIIFRHCFY